MCCKNSQDRASIHSIAKGGDATQNEINILKRIRHDRVVAYYESAEKDNHLHLFMELMTGGSLSDHIKEKNVLSERESRKYTKQMLEGVSFLHSENVIHRDIKGAIDEYIGQRLSCK